MIGSHQRHRVVLVNIEAWLREHLQQIFGEHFDRYV